MKRLLFLIALLTIALAAAACGGSSGGSSGGSTPDAASFGWSGTWTYEHLSNNDTLTITDNGDGSFHAMWQNDGGMGTVMGFGDATPDANGLTFVGLDGDRALVMTPGDDADTMYVDLKLGTKDQYELMSRQ
jgi:hypothetical protein